MQIRRDGSNRCDHVGRMQQRCLRLHSIATWPASATRSNGPRRAAQGGDPTSDCVDVRRRRVCHALHGSSVRAQSVSSGTKRVQPQQAIVGFVRHSWSGRSVFFFFEPGSFVIHFCFVFAFNLEQAKGDALITLIVTESILRYYDLSLEDWERMYVQRVQLRLEVLTKPDQLDRLFDNRFAINWRRQIESEIDLVQARFNQARVVVRPCSRKRRIKVMIESLQEYEAKQLAFLVVQILNENLN